MEPTRMQVAYERLKEKLLRDELRPGDRLANRQLGAELGLSTVTVREAIHRLTSEGLIDHVPNAGAFVKAPSVKQIYDLFDFRSTLERHAISRLCEQVPMNVATELLNLCAAMRRLCEEARGLEDRCLEGERLGAWGELDLQFHELLFAAADNVWLRDSIAQIDLLSRVFGSKPLRFSYEDAAWTWRTHQRLALALRRGDQTVALDALAAHDRRALESSLRAVRERNHPGSPAQASSQAAPPAPAQAAPRAPGRDATADGAPAITQPAPSPAETSKSPDS